MRNWLTNLSYAWQNLKLTPGFIVIVASILGLTIGTLIAVFKLNYLLFAKPLPYPDQERLFKLEYVIHNEHHQGVWGGHTYPGSIKMYEDNDVLEQVGLVYRDTQMLTSHGEQPTVDTSFVTPEYFSMTNASARLGRVLHQSEALKTHKKVAVISYRAWQELFGGNENILNEKLSLNGSQYAIIGVLKKDYLEPEIGPVGLKTDIFLPWDMNTAVSRVTRAWDGFLSRINVFAKVKEGVSVNHAQDRLSALINPHFKQNTMQEPSFKSYYARYQLIPLKSAITGDSGKISLLLLAGVLILVTMAATNILNLFLSRVVHRQRALAIHAALGANSVHLFKSLFTESVIIMGITWIVALVLAQLSFVTLRDIASEFLPFTQELSLDLISAAFGLAVTLLLAVIFALMSIKTIKYRELNKVLQSSGKGSGLQISKRTQQMLIASQICLAIILLFANSQLFKHSIASINQDLGFEPKNLYFVRFASPKGRLSHEEAKPLVIAMKKKLAALDEVEIVSSISNPPTRISGRVPLAANQNFKPAFKPSFRGTDERHFETLGMKMLQGRNFTPAEAADGAKVIILSESLAKAIAVNENPIGMTVYSEDHNKVSTSYRVIGVVEDIALPHSSETMRAFRADGNFHTGFIFSVREGSAISLNKIKEAIASVDGSFRVSRWNKMESEHFNLIKMDYVVANITAVLAILSLILASIGIYGIVSYNTKLKQYELGVRMALGATPQHVLWQVFSENGKAVGIGIILAAVVGTAIYGVARQHLDSYISLDLSTIAFTLIFTCLFILVATYTPVRSIITKWPVASLRAGADH
ncbi:ABC transporter permease [Thalassomonas sp. RHCl1]|uniref:ABC transporter permease n=1 Tax=Thalassomonas sp. RHCl1 TaxID=2995320 RepID=UPI00248B05E1|nr:ABC transporter permease [Thalassomonas sp. RHCl1]